MFGRKKKREKKHKPGMTEVELNKLEEAAARRGFFGLRKTSKHEINVKKVDVSSAKPVHLGYPDFGNDGDGTSIASSQDSPSMQSKHPQVYGGGDAPGQTRKTDSGEPTRTVLEKAAMYGGIASRNKQQLPHVPPMPAPAHHLKTSQDEIGRRETFQHPVPPTRKKPTKLSKHPPSYGQPQPSNKLPPLGSSQQYSTSFPNPESYTHPVSPSRASPPAPQQGYSISTPWLPISKSSNSYFANEDANGVTQDYPSLTKKSPMFNPPTSTKTVVIRKRKSGDFGISLRRSSIIEHTSTGGSAKRTIYFAEPGSSMQNTMEPMPLSPGDRLVAIGDHNVEGASRDEIIELIRSAKDQISIIVQPIPEAAEPTKRSTKLKEHSDEIHHATNISATDYLPMKQMQKKAQDDCTPKIPVPVSIGEKEKIEGRKSISSKTHSSGKPSSSNQGASSSLETDKKEKDFKPSTLSQGLKIVLGKQNSTETENDDATALVVVSPVTGNELHGISRTSMTQVVENGNDSTKTELYSEKMTENSVNTSTQVTPTANPEEQVPMKKKVKKIKVKRKISNKENGQLEQSKDCSGNETPVTCETNTENSSILTNKDDKGNGTPFAASFAKPDGFSLESASDNTPNTSSDVTTASEEPQVEATVTEAKSIPEEFVPADPVFDESQWSEAEKVWFVREDGFSAANLLQYTGEPGTSQVPEGKVRIKLELSGEKVTVDEEKVEKANPEECDRAEDISSLRFLNECGILNTLQLRFNGGLGHTYAGTHLVSICPSHHQSSSPSEKVMEMFKGCRRSDMPPHIFSSAQIAYSEMTTTGGDQSILLTGRSGSGKTQNLRNVLKYLIATNGTSTGQVTAEKLNAASTLLESFSGARTSECVNASRSVNLFTLNYDRSGQVGSASLQCMLLENSRVVRRPKKEENFAVFYQLVEGADTQLSRELFIVEAEQRENPCLFDADSCDKSEIWRENATSGFKKLKSAMEVVGFSADETKAIFNALAACLHLGIAGSQKVGGSRYQFLKPDSAQKASSLLGFSIENLARAIFQPSSSTRTPTSPSSGARNPASLQRRLSSASATGDDSQQCSGQENLEAFITGLYTEVFRLVVSVMNRAISLSNFNIKSSIVVVDTPGFKCPDSSNDTEHQSYASLEDLAYNYVQERLQLLFHHNAFTRLEDRYQQENVSCDFEPLEGDVNAVTDAIDHPPAQTRIGTSNILTDSKGLFWLLDEEALIPGASEEGFIERLSMLFGQPVKNGSSIIKKSHKKSHFVVNHLMGSCPVEYDATNWLRLCRENPITKTVSEVLQDSKKKYISTTIGGRTSSGGTFQGSVVGMDNSGRSLTLRRGTSMRKVWTASSTNINAVVKKKSLSMMKKLQADCLIDALRRTQVHFIFCFTPHRPSVKGQIEVNLLRNQLQGFQLLPATRVHKQGYPEHLVFSEFRRCYEVLCKQIGISKPGDVTISPKSDTLDSMDDREATENILKVSDIERSQYRLGISQVLFRAGILAQLEKRRNEKLSSVITSIQAQCRVYLAKKMFEKRKVQAVAIRCIQRNFQKFLVVRQWPWWRLLTKVLPLVEVHRTEEDLREREAELELLKSKYDKIEAERDELKKENEKYEAQFNDVVGELSEEQATASHASEMLEQETRDRIKLEREVKELQSQNHNLRRRCETVEVELAEQRLLHSADRDGLSDSDEEDDVAEYKMRYDRLRREAEFKHKKELQEFEEKVDQFEADKKHAEKKLHQSQEELEEQERLVMQNKRKAQRTLAELNDARVHLEETNAKLHDLEKKQRKFDGELYAVQAELTEVRAAKDRLQREKDQLSVEIYTKKNMLEENSGDIDILQHKIERLEQELEETTTKDTEEGQMLNNLKKQRRDLEAKIKDQEEELDEQAGQIQMLQQAKERLEMNSERTRQQQSKELDSKEEELEEMRSSYQKRIKHLEKQLEEDEEERSDAAKHRRELEQQLSDLRENQPYAKRDAEAEKRLRKDLKRYKALLDDAQTMIDHLKTDAVNKQQLKQMRAQLEESQYACSNAVKARKAIELELEDVQTQLEEISKAKAEAESKISLLQREKHELNSQIEEDQDDGKEVAKKYKNLVSQQCEDRKEIVELNSQIDDLKRKKEMFNEKILTLQSQLEYLQDNTTDKSNVMRLESKVRDLETKLDFEKTSSRRLDVQLGRLKDQVDKVHSERDSHAASEHREKEQCKRFQKQLRDTKDEQSDILKREQEALQKQHELELELMEYSNQNESLQADLKLAFKRITDLQIAFEDLEDSDMEGLSGSEDSDSDDEHLGSWRRSLVPRSSGAAGSVSSARFSSKLSIPSDDDSSSRKRAPSPEESKFSDSSTSTVRSLENEKPRKERARKMLLKELKVIKANGEIQHSDAMSFRTASVLGDNMSSSFPFSARAEDTMSLCGDPQTANSDFDNGSLPEMRPNSAMGTGREHEYSNKGGLLTRVGKVAGRNAIKLELDRMSKSLADEDPTILMYARPADIGSNLGLGKTNTFRALNEGIMAVKSRQNLPEKQKRKLEISGKIDGEISTLKDEHAIERIASRRSMVREQRRKYFGNRNDDDVRSTIYSGASSAKEYRSSASRQLERRSSGRDLQLNDRRISARNSEGLTDRGIRSSSRGFSMGLDVAETEMLPQRSRFLKDLEFGSKNMSGTQSISSCIQRERQKLGDFKDEHTSYFNDEEYTNSKQNPHRRMSSSNGDELQISLSKRTNSMNNRNFGFDLENNDYCPTRASSRMSNRTSSKIPKGISSRGAIQDFESMSEIGSRSSGSWGSDSFENDDASLAQYGIEDTGSIYQFPDHTRPMSRRYSQQQGRSSSMMNQGNHEGSNIRALSYRPTSGTDMRDVGDDFMTSGIVTTRGRSQSCVSRSHLSESVRQPSFSVDTRRFGMVSARSRSSSRSGISSRMNETPPQNQTTGDGNNSIHSIMGKYLKKI